MSGDDNRDMPQYAIDFIEEIRQMIRKTVRFNFQIKESNARMSPREYRLSAGVSESVANAAGVDQSIATPNPALSAPCNGGKYCECHYCGKPTWRLEMAWCENPNCPSVKRAEHAYMRWRSAWVHGGYMDYDYHPRLHDTRGGRHTLAGYEGGWSYDPHFIRRW